MSESVKHVLGTRTDIQLLTRHSMRSLVSLRAWETVTEWRTRLTWTDTISGTNQRYGHEPMHYG